jgi:hypothetical protein
MTDWKLIKSLADGVDLETLWVGNCGDGKGGVDAREFVVHLVNAWPEIKRMLSARPEVETTGMALMMNTAPTRATAFIEQVLAIAEKRQLGYAQREHGDIVNKNCADAIVELCTLYMNKERLQKAI